MLLLKFCLVQLVLGMIVLIVLRRFSIYRQSNRIFLVLLAHGIAPLLNGLLLFYMVKAFPEQTDNFYLLGDLFFWGGAFSAFVSRDVLKLPKRVYIFLRMYINSIVVGKIGTIAVIPVSIFLIILVQSIFYPVVNNDAAIYISQTEAIAKYKNFEWRGTKYIEINSGEYRYNYSVRPGIPFSIVNMAILLNTNNRYSILQWMLTYYYILLLGIFLLLVATLAKRENHNVRTSLLYGALFFSFSWAMARSVIFNSKESVIYFLTLMSLYLIWRLIEINRRSWNMEIILGVVIGLNSFVNLHGIIIALLATILLFITSPLKVFDRIKQVALIFGVNQLFSAFEIITNLGFLFGDSLFSKRGHADIGHAVKYSMTNKLDIYIKGKLQIFTNVGFFGFYFWIFIGVIARNFKRIWSNNLSRTLVVFVSMYFLVVIDPLNINKHRFAIVLYGSVKYAALILLIGMIVASVYFNRILDAINVFVTKFTKIISVVLIITIASSLYMKSFLVSFGTVMLLKVIPMYKDITFYHDKIVIVYMGSMIILAVLLGVTMLMSYSQRAAEVCVKSLVFCLLIVGPFFITDVGKVSLLSTFKYLNQNVEEKLTKSLVHGDVYDVYLHSKEIIPKGATLKTDFMEVYPYSKDFKLVVDIERAEYLLTEKGCHGREILLSSTNNLINLCALGLEK